METNIEVGIDSKGAKTGAREVNRNLDTLKRNAALTVAGFKRVGGAIKSALSNRAVLVATAALSAAMFKISADTRKFGAAISDLSAITGATGADLKFYSDAAKEFGRTTTLSATQVATAFKLVASAKPDLLANKEALAAVTKEAIALAEASGTDVPNAAKTLGSALNQFGADADQAGRFINVLAAGAKLGASEVEDTAIALRDSGTIAASAGISFEALNASIQTLSTVSIKGSKAGISLRTIFTRLQTQTDQKLNPAIVGLNSALDNLADKNLSVTQLTKLFGQEHFSAASELIRMRKSVADLTVGLTGTSTAYEQAAIKVDNFDGSIKQFSSALEGVSLELGNIFVPSLRSATVAMTDFLNSFSEGERAAKLFKEQIEPNIELIKRFGLSVDDVSPENLERVNATIRAMTLRGIDLKKEAPFEVIRSQIIALGAQSVVLQSQMAGVAGESDGQKIAFAILANELAKVEDQTLDAVDAFNELAAAQGKKPTAPGEAPKGIGDAGEGTSALQSQFNLIQSLRTEAEIFNDEVSAINALWQGGQVDVESYERKIAQLFATLEEDTTQELNDAQKEWIATNDAVLSAYEASRDGAQLYADEVARLTLLFESGLDEESYINRILAAQEILKDSTKETANEWADAWDEAGNRFAEGIGDAVGAALIEQQDFADAMQAITKGVVRQVVSGLVEIGVKQTANFLLGETQKATATTTTNAANVSIATTAAPAVAATSLTSFGTNSVAAIAGILAVIAATQVFSRRQTGGLVEAGKPVLVGEAGAEIIVPTGSGNVIPNGKLGNGGAKYAVFNWNITTLDAKGVEEVILEQEPLFREMIAEFYEENGDLSPI